MVVAAVGVSLAVAVVLAPIMQLLARPLQQGVDKLLPLAVPPEGLLVRLLQREHITMDTYLGLMQRLGFSAEQAENIRVGSLFYPTPSDLVTWQSREVFEPDSVQKYGLDDEFDNLELSPFFKGGMNEEQARNFWRAHWQHPSFGQIADMLHRDLLMGPEGRDSVEPGSSAWERLREAELGEFSEWFRLVEVGPHWRSKLMAQTFLPFTRVDIRRMWDLGVVNDSDVIRAYLDQGYDIDHARALLTFTKVERRLPDLVQMYRNGWIEAEVIREFLISVGVSDDRAEEYIQSKLPNLDAPFRVAQERDLTKAEIIKGVQKEVIDVPTAIGLMVEIGYDVFEAEFIININIESQGSPETPLEFRQLTQAYRKAAKLPAADITPEMLAAEREFNRLDVELNEQLEKRATGIDVTRLSRERQNALVNLQNLYRRAGLPPPNG